MGAFIKLKVASVETALIAYFDNAQNFFIVHENRKV